VNIEGNQFMLLANTIVNMAKKKEPVFYLGKVISISPFIVDIGQLQLDRNDLLINKELLKGNLRKIKIGEQECEVENLENVFKVNDNVALITNDKQLFALLCIMG
jgi:hypothetical protein